MVSNARHDNTQPSLTISLAESEQLKGIRQSSSISSDDSVMGDVLVHRYVQTASISLT